VTSSPPPSTLAAGLIGGLAAELLAGRHRDLLAPLEFLEPGSRPAARSRPVDRAGLARALAVANAAAGHPRAAELAAKLADPAARVVVTGQQTGLLGGPLLALVKAAAAARWAEELEAADGRPAVALFWMATEDHDWQEVAGVTVLAGDGPRTLSLGADPAPLAPVGLRTVGAPVAALLAELAELHPSEWFRAWLDRLAGWWRPEARFGEAFARTHVALLGERAPLYLDSMLPELKAAQAPHLARLVERREAFAAALGRREGELAARGLAPQVAPQPGASPLFLIRGRERRRVEWRGGDGFALRGGDEPAEPVARLLETIAGNPAAVSPGVLARPAIQDAVLGTALFLVGPGEMAYLAQAAAAHEVLDLAPPAVALRPHALVVDRRSREHLEELGATLAELVEAPAAIAERLARRGGSGFVEPVAAALARRIDELRAPALALDPALERPWEKTRDTVARALEAFAGKVAASAGRRDEQAAHRLGQLTALVRPGGRPQERTLAAAWFAGRWGEAFGGRLAAALDLDPRRLSIVDPG
jgi:bacillithiol biosynthesis cysteine-adding enzyme BshC